MEIEILNFIQGFRTPFGDRIMCFFTTLGDYGILWIVLGVLLLLIPKTRKTGWIVVVALILELIVCNGILKNAVARVRPCDVNTAIQLLIPRPEDYSFPSGHTVASFAVMTALFTSKDKTVRKIAVLSAILAVLIAFSRLYLYVHYPTDVLGGILIGILCGLAAAWLVNRCYDSAKIKGKE